jgi:hypothetical protein
VSSVTIGFWQDLDKGNFGRVAGGFEWEYIRRESFPEAGGTVTVGAGNSQSGAGTVWTSDNVFLTSLRWYPF